MQTGLTGVDGMSLFDAPDRNSRGHAVGANTIETRQSLLIYAHGYRVSENEEPYAQALSCDG